MKKTIKDTLNQMRKYAKSAPKTINESMYYESDDDMGFDDEVSGEQQMPQQEEGMNVEAFVDDIRKKALKGMAQLAENPDDERYQILKKIWQICDKKPEGQQQVQKPGM